MLSERPISLLKFFNKSVIPLRLAAARRAHAVGIVSVGQCRTRYGCKRGRELTNFVKLLANYANVRDFANTCECLQTCECLRPCKCLQMSANVHKCGRPCKCPYRVPRESAHARGWWSGGRVIRCGDGGDLSQLRRVGGGRPRRGGDGSGAYHPSAIYIGAKKNQKKVRKNLRRPKKALYLQCSTIPKSAGATPNRCFFCTQNIGGALPPCRVRN